jgi:hypothetical protein
MGVTLGRGPERLRSPAAGRVVQTARWSPALLGALLLLLALALLLRYVRR